MEKGLKKRTVVLFGAGAAIAWQAPTTTELTELILNENSIFRCYESNETVVKFIYNQFLELGFDKKEVNFELLIAAIEELIAYYSAFNKQNNPSIQRILFNSKFDFEFSNFSTTRENDEPGFQLFIPKNVEYPFSAMALNGENSRQFYFQHLLYDIITTVQNRIIEYSYNSEAHTKIFTTNNANINDLFKEWINHLQKNSIVRIYSLNYDYLFKSLAEDSGVNFFDGFQDKPFNQSGDCKPDIQRLLTDFESNIHYNLHGAITWEVNRYNEQTQLESPFVVKCQAPNLQSNNREMPTLQIEKGRNSLLSGIISGFSKTQKSNIAPFKQMHNAFERDCYFTDELIIIGYSFGDAHINAAIKLAIAENPNLQIKIIDPIYSEKNKSNGYQVLQERFIFIFPELFTNRENMAMHRINDYSSVSAPPTPLLQKFFVNKLRQ